MGVEPILSASQAGVHTRYTTDTIDSIKFHNSPTRTRTWNTSLEAKHDRPFHHRAICFNQVQRKAWDLNPHDSFGIARFSKPARPTISGYLPYQWTHRELNP